MKRELMMGINQTNRFLSVVYTGALLVATILAMPTAANATTITIYDQNFESPVGFVNGSGSGYKDLSQQSVNTLYGGQPVSFSFAQKFTVETALLTGGQAFGTGYSDSTNTGGNYAIGMLSHVQNDLLGLSFNIGSYDFFNFAIDISSLGLDGPGGPFVNGDLPKFKFTLFDNPSGTSTTGSGLSTVLDSAELIGKLSAQDVLDWTHGVFAFDTRLSTNGNVTLQVDLLQGGYAVFDNFKITASDEALGGISTVSVPATIWLFSVGLIGVIGLARRKMS